MHFLTPFVDGWEIVLLLGFPVQITGVVAGKVSVSATVFVEAFSAVAMCTLRTVVLSAAEILRPVTICFCLVLVAV